MVAVYQAEIRKSGKSDSSSCKANKPVEEDSRIGKAREPVEQDQGF